MSLGHSDVIHYTRPTGAPPTDNVEEFIQQAKEAGTVKIVKCAKPYTDAGGGLHWAGPRLKHYADGRPDMQGDLTQVVPTSAYFGPWNETGLVNMSK